MNDHHKGILHAAMESVGVAVLYSNGSICGFLTTIETDVLSHVYSTGSWINIFMIFCLKKCLAAIIGFDTIHNSWRKKYSSSIVHESAQSRG